MIRFSWYVSGRNFICRFQNRGPPSTNWFLLFFSLSLLQPKSQPKRIRLEFIGPIFDFRLWNPTSRTRVWSPIIDCPHQSCWLTQIRSGDTHYNYSSTTPLTLQYPPHTRSTWGRQFVCCSFWWCAWPTDGAPRRSSFRTDGTDDRTRACHWSSTRTTWRVWPVSTQCVLHTLALPGTELKSNHPN